MKKTQRKDAVRNILKQKTAWFSMVCVILVGITGLLLASGIGASVEKSAELFYTGTRFRDAEIVYALGLSEDSISRLSDLEQIEELEGFWSFSGMMQRTEDPSAPENTTGIEDDFELWSVHVLSRTERISIPVLAEGRLPENENECALNEALAQRTGVNIGDWIEIQGDRTVSYRLNCTRFLVTGLIRHPHAVTRMRADTVLLLDSAFNRTAGYTGVLALLRMPQETRTHVLSDEYLSCVDHDTEVLKTALPEIAEARIREVRTMLESNFQVRLALAAKRLSLEDLENWLSGPDPDWEHADPRIQAVRPELESVLEELDMDLPGAAALYSEIMSSGVVIQDRRMNESYEYLRSMQQTISRIGLFFAPLFALVGTIVFFSSTLILISDQRYQVGAMKAVGFSKRTILRKYLVFGISAAVTGCLAGIAASIGVNSRILRVWNDQFSIGGLKPYISALTVVLICIPVLAAVVLVVWAACRRLLKCSAVGLINGSEPKRKGLTRRIGKKRKHSLYSELILNNIRTEKPRVVTTVIVIAMSVLLIGASITMRQDLLETFRIQTEEVALYNVTVSVPVSAAPGSRAEIEEILTASSAEWAPAYQGAVIAETDRGAFGCAMLCMSRDEIQSYYNVSVPESDGVTVSYNLSAAYGLEEGAPLSLYSRYLNLAQTTMAGVFEYHIGNLLVIPAETYSELFGSECGSNCYLIRCPEGSVDALLNALREYNREHTDHVSTETVADSMEQFKSIRMLYDLIAGVTILMVSAMNLMIVINLTHILVARRMRDFLLMRVNGFSMHQVRAYLFREMLFTTVPGIVLGVAAGIPFTLIMLRRISTMKITLAVQTVWYAWVIAAVLCAVLAFAVYRIAFRKVRQASLTGIPRQ